MGMYSPNLHTTFDYSAGLLYLQRRCKDTKQMHIASTFVQLSFSWKGFRLFRPAATITEAVGDFPANASSKTHLVSGVICKHCRLFCKHCRNFHKHCRFSHIAPPLFRFSVRDRAKAVGRFLRHKKIRRNRRAIATDELHISQP